MRSKETRQLHPGDPRRGAQRQLPVPERGDHLSLRFKVLFCFVVLVSFLFVSVQGSAEDTQNSSLDRAGDPLRASGTAHPPLLSHAPVGGRCPWWGPAEAGLLCPSPGTTAASPVTDSPGGRRGPRITHPRHRPWSESLYPRKAFSWVPAFILEYSWPRRHQRSCHKT